MRKREEVRQKVSAILTILSTLSEVDAILIIATVLKVKAAEWKAVDRMKREKVKEVIHSMFKF